MSGPDPITTDGGWSARQLRALAAVFGTICRPIDDEEADRHARLAAAALSEVAEPSDLQQLRLVLDLLEARVGLPGVTGFGAFSSMSQAAREQLLLAWSTSRIPQRRTFFQTVKRLAAFFAYADPGLDRPNPRWPEIAYQIDEQPSAVPGVVAGALIRVAAWPTDLELDTEVVVVGSGAGGGVVAARLAELGHAVVVVEAGPYVPEHTMQLDELDAFTRMYLDHGMTSTADLSVAILAGAALGGGTLINWTTCFDPPADVRSYWARQHGLEGFDGESTDADLARLRVELGFTAPEAVGPKDEAILRGAAALGWAASPTERSTDGCGDCGACPLGCRRGAKRSGVRLHLAIAARHGARFLVDAPVDTVKEGVVEGVLAPGRRFRVRAKTVVLAAGPLRTPLILERSGVAHPHLGQNLRLHPTVAIGARYDALVEMWRGTMQAASLSEFLRDGYLIEAAPAHPGLIALAFPWDSAAGLDELMRDIRHYAPVIGIVRDEDGGRVSLSRSGRARISYRLSRRDADKARAALVAMARLSRAAGAHRMVALGTPPAWHDEGGDAAFESYLDRLRSFDAAPNRLSLFSAHQMGTVRAGADPHTHPCDPYGRVRGATNLYVADASLFPTSIGVNPMVTVMAMAARVARAIHADGSIR